MMHMNIRNGFSSFDGDGDRTDLLSRLVPRPLSNVAILLAALLWIGNGLTTAAQPPRTPRPKPLPVWQFANIHVTALGPNIVKIDWIPFASANKYFVQRNGAQISPVIQSTPGTKAPLSFTDNSAPANSNLTYTVTALSISTIFAADGTKHTGELPHISNAVAVVTPAEPLLRWVLSPDAQPSIPPNSEVLLFIPGMDSRAEEADDLTKALFMALPSTPATPPVWPKIKDNSTTVNFTSCPNPKGGCPETCDHLDDRSSVPDFPYSYPFGRYPLPVTPVDMVDGVKTQIYFAPSIPLQLLDPAPIPAGEQINVPAAHNIGANEGRLHPTLRAMAARADPSTSLAQAAFAFAAGDTVWGKAYADLSVTGHKSFAIFRQNPPAEGFCQSLGKQPAPFTANVVVNGCRTALDRAYRVANFLRTGERGDTPALRTAKAAERVALGYIAVSGEDDSPHRPVNVPSSDFPQYDLQVAVETPFVGPSVKVNVHTRYTIAQFQISGRNIVVISVDLPTSGYADNLNYNVVSPLGDVGQPKFPNDFGASGNTRLLDFIEAFVVRFAETLDGTIPFRSNIKAVMGGSLGGNLTFRLGRRPNVPWLPEFVVWSPASIWDSLARGADVGPHLGLRQAWFNADQAMNTPGGGDRSSFFGSWDKPTVPLIIPVAQSGTWTSDYYLCKYSSVAGARLDRQETYDAHFLAWHWRLGLEQLIFSHQTIDPKTTKPLFMANTKPMLLACGLEDNVPYNDICSATQKTAAQMLTPGKALFLGQTGHSLDNERRSFWAQQIIAFLGL